MDYATLPTTPTTRPRLDSLDFLRGLVMVLMALDHVRDFFSNVRFDPLDLTHTTAPLFLTRWVTHFCAPTFMLLAGAGAYLYGRRGHTTAEVSRFLLARGLWLVLLELTLVRFGWLGNLTYSLVLMLVIWAIGWSMVALAALVYLPVRVVAGIGVAIIGLHNLLNPLVPAQFGPLAWLWIALHEGGFIPRGAGGFAFQYPVLPWIGVMAAGYGLGALLELPTPRRHRILHTLGLSMMAAFVLLGLLNVYGDTVAWTPQRTTLLTVFSFLDVEKYPPALLYLLVTLGPVLAVLPALESLPDGSIKRFFVTFGRVPLFYYLLHILLIRGLALGIARLQGLSTAFLTNDTPFHQWPAAWGFSLPVVYLLWIGVVLALYPLCRWFAGVKARSQQAWLSYL